MTDLGFEYTARKSGDVVISRNGVTVTTIRGKAAAKFLIDVARGDAQQVMARATGNYKRGNERAASPKPRDGST
jgi:hypothetical protein